MRDAVQGRLLLLLSFLLMAIYFYALLFIPTDKPPLERDMWEWAIIIPVTAIVCIFLIVVAWIGWAMSTTPPSIPSTEIDLELLDKKNNNNNNISFFIVY
jgi:hypothetical protein